MPPLYFLSFLHPISRIAKLSDGPVNPNIYIRDEAVKGTISDDERQTEQGNTEHAKLLTEQSDEPSGMELLTQIAARFRGLKCSTRASVWVAGQEVILPVPDCMAATNPREIVLDGVVVTWPWDYRISDELLEMARRDERSFLHSMGGGIGLLRVKAGLEDQVAEIIRQLRSAA